MTELTRIDQILDAIREHPIKRVAVASGAMASVIEAADRAGREHMAETILVGDQPATEALARELGVDLGATELVHEPDRDEAARRAVRLVSSGQADIVMKGDIHTDDFLRALLMRENGLRTGRLLSHAFVLEASHLGRLLIVTDAAMNIAPDFADKAQIARNAIDLAILLGVAEPKVAVLAAVELVNPRMQATQDAAILSLMSHRGQFERGVVEGPFALDNAISVGAARVKRIVHPVAGHADILLVPDIEAGNILVKSFTYLARGRAAGILLGAQAPVVLTSRADSAEAKYLSIGLAVYAAAVGGTRVKLGALR